MMRCRYGALVALAVLPIALAACGGGGNGASSEDQTQITKSIELAATSGDPQACTDAQTQKFTEQTSGGTGQEAIANCQRDAADSVADSVDVTNVETDGNSATADIAFHGSVLDGQKLSVNLVKEGDTWKLDQAGDFVDLDKAKLAAALKTELDQQQGIPPGAGDCVAKQIQGLSDDQVKALLIDSDQQVQNQVFGACVRD
jgi:hypothetical protein